MKVKQLTREQLIGIGTGGISCPNGIELLHKGPDLYKGRYIGTLIIIKGDDGIYGFDLESYGSYKSDWDFEISDIQPYRARQKMVTVWEPVE